MSTQVEAPVENGAVALQRRIRHRIEIITPEIAVKMLEQNLSNRKLDQTVVERYARDMKAQRWHLTGDPIQLGISGRLLNGQHRLWACVMSDASFETMVIRGLVDETAIVDVIDTGKKRTLGSALQIHGEKSAILLASIINACWRYEHEQLWNKGLYPTHEEGIHWLNENPDVREAVLVARSASQVLHAQPTSVGAAYYLNSRVDVEKADEFWQKAVTGEGLLAGSAILAYRRWVIGTIAKRDRPKQEVWLAYHFKAMSLFKLNRNVRILVVKPDEQPGVWSA